MLNQLAKDLGGKVGNTYPNIKGEIKIISELPYCDSCTGVIQQFNEMFPNVKLNITEFKIKTILKTPNQGIKEIDAGWIIKPEKIDELILSTPLADR